jgi:uncharacterized protein YhhL (DUF1145 family)
MVGKTVVGVIWVWSIACLLAPALPLASAGRAVFWILVVVHAIECVAFLPRLRGAGGSLANHLLQTFLFGIAHVSTLPRAAESRE